MSKYYTLLAFLFISCLSNKMVGDPLSDVATKLTSGPTAKVRLTGTIRLNNLPYDGPVRCDVLWVEPAVFEQSETKQTQYCTGRYSFERAGVSSGELQFYVRGYEMRTIRWSLAKDRARMRLDGDVNILSEMVNLVPVTKAEPDVSTARLETDFDSSQSLTFRSNGEGGLLLAEVRNSQKEVGTTAPLLFLDWVSSNTESLVQFPGMSIDGLSHSTVILPAGRVPTVGIDVESTTMGVAGMRLISRRDLVNYFPRDSDCAPTGGYSQTLEIPREAFKNENLVPCFFFKLGPWYGKAVISGLAYVGGRAVGTIDLAVQPNGSTALHTPGE